MEKKKENCYFWIDEKVPEEVRGFNIYCEECQKKHPEVSCWFWEGSTKGYGPFDYICDGCNKVIHKPEHAL